MANIEKSRNTTSQLDWYEELEAFIASVPWSDMDKASYFPVFTPRQTISRFIECYEFYKLARNIPGCFVECGVGSGLFLMALAHFCSIFEGYHYTRRIIGFDTFCGFTEPSKQDSSSKAEHMKKGGLSWDSLPVLEQAIGLHDRNRVLGHLPKIELVKGDISQTLPKYLDENPSVIVGMLHLDLDLYKPTRDALELLMERLPKGALIVFDEPNHPDYPGETIAMMETVGIHNLRLQRLEMSSMAAYAFIE